MRTSHDEGRNSIPIVVGMRLKDNRKGEGDFLRHRPAVQESLRVSGAPDGGLLRRTRSGLFQFPVELRKDLSAQMAIRDADKIHPAKFEQ